MKAIVLLVCTALLLTAAPAFERERTFTQPDGSTFKGRAQGDEFLHWIETESGDIVLYNPAAERFEYARITETDLQCSGVLYGADVRSASKRATAVPALSRIWEQKRQVEMERRDAERQR